MKKILFLLAFLATSIISCAQYGDELPVVTSLEEQDSILVLKDNQYKLAPFYLFGGDGGGGTSNHGLLNGLDGDDHLHYLTEGRADTWFSTKSLLDLGSRDHADLLNIGSYSHDQIDAHINSGSNPHLVTANQIGLSYLTNSGSGDAWLDNSGNYSVPPGASYTFGNGLTENAGTVSLGAALSQDVTFTGSLYDFNIGFGASPIGQFNVYASGNALINSEGALQFNDANTAGIVSLADVETAANTIDVSGGGTLFLNDAGIYAAPPGTNYTFLSGISEAGNNVNLGGALTQNATFTGASYDFNIGFGASKIRDFNLAAAGYALFVTDEGIAFHDSSTADPLNLSEIEAVVNEDRLPLDSLVHMRSDAKVAVFGAGMGNAEDTQIFQVGGKLGDFPTPGTQNIRIDSMWYWAEGNSGDITVRVEYLDNPFDLIPNVITSSDLNLEDQTFGKVYSFATPVVPVFRIVHAYITGVTTEPESARLYIFYHEETP